MKVFAAVIVLAAVLMFVNPAESLDFFSTCYVETYRTDLGTNLISPNIYFQAGSFDGYGFWDYYLNDPNFFHGEFMLAYTPLKKGLFNRVSVISEFRWDRYAKDEKSIGLRFKIW
ncbi:hypothetical protein ISS30_09345 [bacterium]|nr:hypothetical protein [bacterium]